MVCPMPLLTSFDPPANMSDFDRVAPGSGAKPLRAQWTAFISQCFDETIAVEKDHYTKARIPNYQPQYYNASKTDPGATVEQEIPWNAFPKELLRRYGRERALVEADRLWPLSWYNPAFDGPDAATTFYRPHNEYCEWHVVRDPNTAAIRRITFTSEPPEYWQALFGDVIQTPKPGSTFQFSTGDKHAELLELYRSLVSPKVQLDDLIAQADIVISAANGFVISKGQYNFYNKWNIAYGIAHLAAPPNSLVAEVQLGGDATVLFRNGNGDLVVEPDPLICCAAYGGPDRNSDPTIGATVNALARLGAMVTLRNPVGLYMDHVDHSGWVVPDKIRPEDCIHVVRGDPGRRMIERLVVEVPPESGYTVSDITIGGEPVRYGGQIAECITVKLVGVGAPAAGVENPALSCNGRCCVDPADLKTLNRPVSFETDDNPPPGKIDAFAGEGAERAVPVTSRIAVASAAAGLSAPAQRPRAAHHRRHRAN